MKWAVAVSLLLSLQAALPTTSHRAPASASLAGAPAVQLAADNQEPPLKALLSRRAGSGAERSARWTRATGAALEVEEDVEEQADPPAQVSGPPAVSATPS